MQAAIAGAIVASPNLLCTHRQQQQQQHALSRLSLDSLAQLRVPRKACHSAAATSFSIKPNLPHLNVSCRSKENSICEKEPSSSSPSPSLPGLPSPKLRQDNAPKRWLRRAESLLERVSERGLGNAVLPLGAALYFQVWTPAIAEVVESAVSDEDLEFMAGLATTGVLLFLYFFIVPLIVYTYLRRRWFKRNTLETFFQFMLVFIFFPGMLLLAPFINFRNLPRKGTKPP